MLRNVPLLAIAAGALLIAGCGGNGTYPVQGKVVYQDGSPATDLTGYFISMDLSEKQLSASGVVQPDGTFKVGTFEDDDGAVPGKYRVALTPPEAPVDMPSPKPVIAKTYGSLASSGLEVEVKPEPNEVTLQVQKLKAK
jgi:hypothetical protein